MLSKIQNEFPRDVLTQIFKRLPIKFLHCLMCVCKSWHAFLNDPEFITAFDKLTSSNHLKIIVWKTSLYTVDVTDINGGTLKIDFLPNLDQRCYRMTSCNGLLCFYDRKINDIILGNPSNLSYQILRHPKSNEIKNDSVQVRAYFLGFGYIDRLDDYRVVRIVTFSSTCESTFMVYSLRSGTWKQIGGLSSKYQFVINYAKTRFHTNTCVNNSLHWIVREKSPTRSITISKTILKLDLLSENVSFVPMPDHVGEIKNTHYYTCVEEVGALGEYLYFSKYDDGYNEYNLWIMKEYGVKESWTELVHFKSTLINQWNIKHYVRPIAYLEEEFKVMFINGDEKVYCYNVLYDIYDKMGEIKGLPLPCSTRNACTYLPKLVQLKRPHYNSMYTSSTKKISETKTSIFYFS